jgi:hypothetical protein
MKNHWVERLRELEMAGALAQNQRAAEADAEAKRQVAMRIESARAAFIERQITASQKATERALEILQQPFGDCRPDAAAKLFSVGHSIGASVLNLPGAKPA